MKRTWFLFILIFVVCLNACSRSGSISDTDRSDIHQMVLNGVPYAFSGDEMLDYAWYKETDAYGRELFLYQSELHGISGRQDIYVISQKSEGGMVYYYEDFFYLTYPNGGAITEDDLFLLKERNDWNKPLDESKMIGIYYEQGKGYEPADYRFATGEGERIREYFRNEFMLPLVCLDGLGTDAKGSVVFLVLTQKGSTYNDIVGRYLARIDQTLNPDSIEYIAIDEGFNLQEIVYSFRTGG